MRLGKIYSPWRRLWRCGRSWRHHQGSIFRVGNHSGSCAVCNCAGKIVGNVTHAEMSDSCALSITFRSKSHPMSFYARVLHAMYATHAMSSPFLALPRADNEMDQPLCILILGLHDRIMASSLHCPRMYLTPIPASMR